MNHTRACVLSTTLLMSACVVSDDADHQESDDGEPGPAGPRTVEVGPEGGVLADGAIRLEIPPDALAEPTELSVTLVEDIADVTGALSPRWRFEPSGLQFARPVWVEVELPNNVPGTLLWSTADDEETFAAIGIAAGGVASGYTTHFSEAYVGAASCEAEPPPSATRCTCRAGDEIGDALCPTDPALAEGMCPDISGFMGTDGSGCAGYGPRDEIEFHCACYSETRGHLCPEPLVLGPMQQCPNAEGLGGHIGEEGGSCSGYDIDYNAQTMESVNVSASGTLVDCSPVVLSTEFESVGGQLEGCYETSVALPPCSVDANGNEYYGVTAACKMRLDALATAKQTTACPAAVGTATTVGTRAGNQIESILAAQPDWYTQVKVPFGSKKSCDTMAPPEARGNGKVDLLRVVSRGGGVTTIEIAEVKPLTPTGIPAGFHEVYECYKDVLSAVGAGCTDDPVDVEVGKFCEKIGALKTKVVVADPVGLQIPDLSFDYKAADDSKHPMVVQTCFPGVFAYSCK
ncbi:MAG: hypothetical protein IAG13_02170 [Deltaproteobacteria bacterium]|nr:hypothetical protein [Nannocystaceae bacterium]